MDSVPREGPRCVSQLLRKVLAHGRQAHATGYAQVRIMVCADDEDLMHWIGELRMRLPGVYVTDAYEKERLSILHASSTKRFTRVDYAVKAMLGPNLWRVKRVDE